MGKLATMMIIMTGIVVLMHLTQIITIDNDTPNSTLLNIILNPESFQDSPFHLRAILITEAIALAGIAALALVVRSDFLLMAALIPPFFNFGWDFLIVYRALAEASPTIALIIFSPIMVFYIVTVVEWWRAMDT
jgi:hypothetical protein